jgi:hypothetical protein
MNPFSVCICLDSYIVIDVHLVCGLVFSSVPHISTPLSFEKLSQLLM